MNEPGETTQLKIFVVENHADTLKYLVLYLQKLGHAVTSARLMRDAAERLPSAHCDVLISDIGLPDGSGWELINRSGISPAPFAIAMTGFGTVTDREKSLKAGYRHHLIKPFSLEDLDAMLEEAKREKEASLK